MTPVLSFTDVCKSFRGVPLVQGVSCEIEPGAAIALRGPNGSGKSVLLRLMCRMMVPTSGTVTIAERYLGPGRTYPDHFGVTIDGPAYLASLSGVENLSQLARIRDRITLAEIQQIMADLGLDPESRRAVRRYSMGMKQKLSLCQALMEKPEVLLLDEPFNALDEKTVSVVKARLHDLHDQGVTLVLTSHNAEDLDEFATASLVLEGGTLAHRQP